MTRRRLAAGVVMMALGACSSRSPDRSGSSGDDLPAPRAPVETAPAGVAKAPAGVAPLASAPRADWPCARTIDAVGARVTYDYGGAPEMCWFPPDLWQPGCPTRHVQANPEMGLEIEVRYRYDDRHRLVGIDSKLRLATIEKIEYDGDRVVAQDSLSYHPAGGAVHIWHADGSFYGVVEPGPQVGIARLRTGGDSPADDDVLSDERFDVDGTRLRQIRAVALGQEEVHVFEYDCP